MVSSRIAYLKNEANFSGYLYSVVRVILLFENVKHSVSRPNYRQLAHVKVPKTINRTRRMNGWGWLFARLYIISLEDSRRPREEACEGAIRLLQCTTSGEGWMKSCRPG